MAYKGLYSTTTLREPFNMKMWKPSAWLSLAAVAMLALGGGLGAFHPHQAHAQLNLPMRSDNIRSWGFTSTLLNTSVSATTPVNVLSLANTPINDPNSYSVPGYLGGAGYGQPKERLRVYWSADVSKATSTTGFCEVYANGALVAASKRSIGYAGGEGTLAGVYDTANTVTGAQTIYLECGSGDTATFTITQASMRVDEAY